MSDTNETAPTAYTDPVARLLALGKPPAGPWPDYVAEYGLTESDVPALAQMVQDETINYAPTDSNRVWASLHAWRALGQLGVEEGIEGLLSALYAIEEEIDDWMMREMPVAMGMLGPGVLPALSAYLVSADHGLWPRVLVSRGVGQVGQQHPAARERAVEILAAQLARHESQDAYLNATLVADLTDLEAVEAEEVMAAAFAAGNVDLAVQGDWEEVQIKLGLLDERQTPVPEEGWIPEIYEMVKAIEQREAQQAVLDKMQRQEWGKVGRNDPCPCGSGRKYKRCHGRPG